MTSTLRPNRTESCRFMLEWEGRELRWFVVDVLLLQPPVEGPSEGCCFVTREIGVGVSSRVSHHGSPCLGSCRKTGHRSEPDRTVRYSHAVESPHATVDWLPGSFSHIISPPIIHRKVHVCECDTIRVWACTIRPQNAKFLLQRDSVRDTTMSTSVKYALIEVMCEDALSSLRYVALWEAIQDNSSHNPLLFCLCHHFALNRCQDSQMCTTQSPEQQPIWD